jgi:hypothetical protein
MLTSLPSISLAVRFIDNLMIRYAMSPSITACRDGEHRVAESSLVVRLTKKFLARAVGEILIGETNSEERTALGTLLQVDR